MKKLVTLRQVKPHKTQTCPQNLLRKIPIFLEILFLEIIIIAFPILFSKLPEKCNYNTSSYKGAKASKDNYRPVSILSNIFKIYERLMFKQISEYFEAILSKFQCDFRKGLSAQHCLLVMLEKWKSAVDNKINFGVLLTDLSKVFDCLSHDHLLAKLNAYGFSLPALRLVQRYLSNRKQRTKINSEFSSLEEILFGVPQV